MHRLMACLVLAASVAAACSDSGSAGPKTFKDPKDLAKSLGCESSYVPRNQDILFPEFIKAYGKCTVNGHDALLTVFFKSGDPERVRDDSIARTEQIHWVSGDTWSVDVPLAKPGEIKKLKDKLGDSTAEVKE